MCVCVYMCVVCVGGWKGKMSVVGSLVCVCMCIAYACPGICVYAKGGGITYSENRCDHGNSTCQLSIKRVNIISLNLSRTSLLILMNS